MSRIDRTKLNVVKKGFRFLPFRPEKRHHTKLSAGNFKPDRELIAFERHGERRVVLLNEMTYHHIIQGELAGEPYLVTF